jgi:hypothetical protein
LKVNPKNNNSEVEKMSKFCRNCGKELSDQAAFCGECGATFDVPTKTVVTPTATVSAPKNVSVGNPLSYEISSNGVVVSSPQPFEDKMKTYHIVIWTIAIVLAIICMFGYGVYGLIYGIVFAFAFSRLEYKKFLKCTRPLVNQKYRFVNKVSYKQLFSDMQPIFISKYNYVVEVGDDFNMVLANSKFSYSVTVWNDGTFTIKYHIPLVRIIFSINDYLDYKKLISDMAIIAYEIQRKYEINQ